MSYDNILQIPNKKVNYSPQYRNMVPGENVEFNPVDNRVDRVSTSGGSGSGTKIITSDTEPTLLSVGDYWFNSF